MSNLKNLVNRPNIPNKIIDNHSASGGVFNCEKSNLGVYNCKHCKFSTHLQIILKKHIEICHSGKPLNKRIFLNYPFRNYICKKCPFRTHLSLSFLKHKLECKQKLKIYETKKNTPVDLTHKSIHSFRCKWCSYCTQYKSNLRSHRLTNHQEPSEVEWLQCLHCTFRTKYKAGLNTHILYKHTPDELINWQKCDKCAFKAKGRNILRRHIINKHTSEEEVKWFNCDQCLYKAKQKDHLQNHLLFKHFKDLCDVFLEKHWRSVISRSVCDYYLEAQRANPNDISPVIATPHHYLISIQRGGVSFVAVCMEEIPPLFVIEFLHRVVDTFQDYFSDCTESIIKENYVVIYELLDEMLDNGFPLATESNILKELIKPPNILRTIANTVTGKTNVSEVLPTGQLSNIPWRRTGVKYTNNEAYFDVIEEVDAIIDKSGATVFAEIQGYIDCCIKLSGMPDLTLSFMNPRLFDDVSFHPCVRFKRWEAERVLSFIPPDGNFRLISYHISSQSVVAIPIYVRHNLSIKTGEQGRLDLTVGPKQTLGRTVEAVKIEVLMPKCILNCVLTANQGKYNFDPVSKILHWDIGRIDVTKLPNIRGSVSIASGSNTAEINPSINVHFTINQLAVSGLKVNRLDMYGEKYKPFKGVKYITKAGRFQIRM